MKSTVTNSDRIAELDKKIKRYEGVEVLFDNILDKKKKGTIKQKKSCDIDSQNYEPGEDDQG
jgi:hypothetical protein